MTGFTIVIPGKPTGKGRIRFNGKQSFIDKATAQAERDVLGCWIDAGEPRLDGPVQLLITLVIERPKGHFRKGGELAAEGLRHPYPENQKPDVDNALKLVMDALNGRAWRDDVQVVDVGINRQWGPRAETVITAVQLATRLTETEAVA